MTELTKQVKQNLEYYTLWTDVAVHRIPESDSHIGYANQNLGEELEIISGYPPAKLSSADETHMLEWVIPVLVKSQDSLTVKTINFWFKQIESLCGARPKRVTVGLVNKDSTVVYYFIHDGLVKPVQN